MDCNSSSPWLVDSEPSNDLHSVETLYNSKTFRLTQEVYHTQKKEWKWKDKEINVKCRNKCKMLHTL